VLSSLVLSTQIFLCHPNLYAKTAVLNSLLTATGKNSVAHHVAPNITNATFAIPTPKPFENWIGKKTKKRKVKKIAGKVSVYCLLTILGQRNLMAVDGMMHLYMRADSMIGDSLFVL
jgi:hypothetical protein